MSWEDGWLAGGRGSQGVNSQKDSDGGGRLAGDKWRVCGTF